MSDNSLFMAPRSLNEPVICRFSSFSRTSAPTRSPSTGEGAVGVIVGAALIIFLVLLITDLLGLTDVYPFVKK